MLFNMGRNHSGQRLKQLEDKLNSLEQLVRKEKNATKIEKYKKELDATIAALRKERNTAQVKLARAELKERR